MLRNATHDRGVAISVKVINNDMDCSDGGRNGSERHHRRGRGQHNLERRRDRGRDRLGRGGGAIADHASYCRSSTVSGVARTRATAKHRPVTDAHKPRGAARITAAAVRKLAAAGRRRRGNRD